MSASQASLDILTPDDLPSQSAANDPLSVLTQDDMPGQKPSFSDKLNNAVENALAFVPGSNLVRDPNTYQSVKALGAGAINQIGKLLYNLSPTYPNDPSTPTNPADVMQNTNNPLTDFGKSLKQSNPIAYGAGSFIGQALPLVAGGPELGLTDLAAPYATSLARNAAAATANNFAFNPSDPVGNITGGVVGGALGASIPYGINAAAKYIKSAIDPEIQQASDYLGANLGMGELTQDPNLMKFSQNVLTKIPFSGAAQKYGDIANNLQGHIEDVLGNMSQGKSLDDIPKLLQSKLQDTYNDVSDQKDALYNKFGDYSRKNDISGNVDDFLSQAENIKNNNPEMYKQIQPIVDSIKQPINAATGMRLGADMGDLSLAAGKLNQVTRNYYKSPDPFVRSQGNDVDSLRDTLIQNMSDSAQKSGDPQAINLFNDAQSNYGQNYAPFLDKDVSQFLSQGKNADNPDAIVQKFLQPGQYGKPTMLNKFLSKLPDDQQKQVGYYFLSRNLARDPAGNPIADINKVTNNYGQLANLPQASKDALFSPSNQATLSAVSKVRSTLPNLTANPVTGARAADLAPAIGAGILAKDAATSEKPIRNLALLAGLMGAGRLGKIAMFSPLARSILTSGFGNKSYLPPLISAAMNAQQAG